MDVPDEKHSPHGFTDDVNDELSFSKDEEKDSVFMTTIVDNEDMNELTEESYRDLVNDIPPPLQKKTTI